MQADLAGATTPPRRTQRERREATRAKLMAATIYCLERLGHAATTTTEICKHAGLSQGALFRHFPAKANLMSAAAEHLFAALIEDYRRAFARIDGDDDRLTAAAELLWDMFEQPRLLAAFELYVAARTDRQLAAALEPVSEAHRENIAAQARELFPEVGDNERLVETVGFIVDAFQGAALSAMAGGRPGARERMIALATRLGRDALEASA